jgi:1,4-dihydroxy-2-naphthoate octaprenyltransferase
LGAYYVQVNSFATQAFLAGLVPGILMWAMIIINEIPDFKEDKRAKKMNLVVRIGRKNGSNAFMLSVGFIYLFITSMSLLGVFPLLSLISLLSGPFAINSVRYLRKYYLNKDKVFLANKEMVKLYSSTVLLFSLGFLI